MTAVHSYAETTFIPYPKHGCRAAKTKLPPGTAQSVTWSARYITRADINAFEMTVPHKSTRAYLQMVLAKVSLKEKAAPIREFLHRCIICADAIVDGVKEREQLSYREAFIISLESMITALFAEKTPLYRKRNEKFARAVIIDKVNSRFILLSKKFSLRQTGGTCKKISHAFVVSLQSFQVNRAMRITNFIPPEYPLELVKLRVEMMRNEVQLARRVNNDIYVTVDRTSAKGLPKIDWVEDEYECDLYDYVVSKGSFTGVQEISFLAQIAGCLFHKFHDQGIVHYDIKPENVLLTVNPDGTIRTKLTDFNLSFDKHIFQYEGQYVVGYGTADYSSPETFMPKCRLQDPLEQAKADDMYAMGCLLYELLFKQTAAWFDHAKVAVEKNDSARGNIAFKLQSQGYEWVKFIALTATTPHKMRLKGICRDLLDPNPQTRLKSHQLIYRLLLD